MTVRAQESPNSDISYSISNKVFKFSVNSKEANITTGQLQYQLSYKNDSSDNPEQIEVAQGTTDLGDSNFEKTVDAATCSTNGTCRVHVAPRGILKIKMPGWTDIKWFSISGETVTVVNEKFDGVMDTITDEERNWLLKGDAPAPTATPEPPTPTAEPTVIPTVLPPTSVPTVEPTISVAPTGSTLGAANGDEVVQVTVVDTQAYVNPSIWTNQSDYAPTQTVYVSGKNFTPGYAYSIIISSNDPPAVTATGSVTAATDGTFTYAYQLDGNYRPNYLVQVKDTAGTVVAQTSFTDGSLTCINDSSGAGDVPGQKDLTMMCYDYSGTTSERVTWNWDDIGWSGGNTGDACSLYDTNNDGLANFALCATVGHDPAVIQSTTLYSCGNGNADKCSNPQVVISPFSSSCTASTSGDDPFPADPTYKMDTKADCNIIKSDFGLGSTPKLIDVCSYPSQQPNSDPSDCIVASTANQTGQLEVVKSLVPTKDSGLFNLQIDSGTLAVDVGNGGTTHSITVDTGSHSVSETASTNTDLTNYNSSITCKDAAGLTVASGTGTTLTGINIVKDAVITCTITNTRKQATLTVNKVLVPSGDLGRFDLQIDGSTAGTGANVGNGGTTGAIVLSPGSHTVSEIAAVGTDLSLYTPAISGDCAANGSITLASNDNKTCTITNTLKTGNINIIKNTEGGDGTFGFAVTGPNSYSSSQSITTNGGAGTTNNIVVTAGNGYSVTENNPPTGWVKGTVVCLDGTTPVTNTNFNVSDGHTVTCTFTNTKQPVLTVTKLCDPTGDNGKFNLNIDGISRKTDASCGQSTDPVILTVGAHTISETQGTGTILSNYTSAIGGDCGTDGNIALAAGDVKSCTITNTLKRGSITVKKVMDGGTGSFNFTGDINGSITTNNGTLTTNNLLPGIYSVTEAATNGWDLTGISCNDTGNGGTSSTGELTSKTATFNVEAGENVTCTFTNTKKGSISGYKYSDADGNLATTNDQISLSGWGVTLYKCSGSYSQQTCTTQVGSATTDANGYYSFADLPPGEYRAIEESRNGWSALQPVSGINDIGLAAGANPTANFINHRDTGDLQVYKVVDNSSDLTQWSFSLDGGAAVSANANGLVDFGQVTTLDTHTIRESGPSNFHFVSVTGTSCTQNQDNSASATVTKGGTTTCTFTNNRNIGTLSIHKQDQQGNAMQGVTVAITGASTASLQTDGSGNAVFTNIPTGDYTVAETSPVNYHWDSTSGDCTNANPASVTVTTSGQTCTFVNKRDTGNLKAVKVVDDRSDLTKWSFSLDGGAAVFAEADGSVDFGQVTTSVNHVITESGPNGYHLVNVTGSGCSQSGSDGADATVSYNGSTTCTFTNNLNRGTVTVHKTVLGTSTDLSQFCFTLSPDPGTGPVCANSTTGDAVFANIPFGTYTAAETASAPNYAQTATTCDIGMTITNNGDTQSCTVTNTRETGTIVVNKLLNPSADAGKFNLQIGGVTKAIDQVNNGTTGYVTLDTGNYTVGEVAGTNTNLSDYVSSYTCNDGETVLDSGNAVTSNTFALRPGHTVVCTFTNTRLPELTLIKNILNDNGGAALATAWTLSATGPTTITGKTGEASVTNALVPVGSYTLSESSGPTGYTSSGYSCIVNGGQAVVSDSLTLAAGDVARCTVTNNDNTPSLTLNKILDIGHGGTAVESDWTLTADGGEAGILSGQAGAGLKTNDPDIVSGPNFKTGTYSLSESGPTKGYAASDWTCTGGTMPDKTHVTVGLGENVACTLTNHDNQAILIVKKVVVDSYEEPAPASSFTVHVSGSGMLVNDKTNQSEADIPGSSTGVEIPINGGAFSVNEPAVPGYTTTYAGDCSGTIGVGDIYTCTVTNTKEAPPILTLSKFNTTWPNDTSAGSNVEYHLKVKVEDNSMNGIVVTDLMPKGFTYVGGSYRVFKNGADITSQITEPVYHSPGKWYLGDAKVGDTYELVYTAAIDGGQKPGLYKDLAWAYGCANSQNCSLQSEDVALAQSVGSGTVDPGTFADTGNFVGTKVNLNKNLQDTPSVNLSQSQGEVLGASTSLPSTGTPNYLFIISSLFTMLGLLLTVVGFYKRRALKAVSKLAVYAVIFSAFLMVTGSVQAAGNLYIRLEQPKSPTRVNDFTLSYTAMDMVGDSGITVKCYKKGPSDSSFSQMGGDQAVIAGGNNGLCPLESSMIGGNGTYEFYATAESGNGSAISETISVDYNTNGPGTPSSYGKDKISNCEYKVHFKTADDSQTAKVEIYRSENTSFTADGGTRVSTLNIGPNQDGSYNDMVPDCNKTYYYAVRAFDSAGNGSGVIGDSVTTATTSTTSSTTQAGGAIPVANVTLAAGAQEGSVLGASEENVQSSSSGKAASEGAVLAAETQKTDGGMLEWVFGHKKISLGILLILSLLVFGVIRYARKQRSTGGPNFQ